MKVLHLASSVSTSNVYKSIFEGLAKLNINSLIYSLKYKHLETDGNLSYLTSSNKNICHKIFLIFRVVHSLFDIMVRNSCCYDLIHAHTLYVDGFVALALKVINKKQYIVTVRNTDFNYHARFRIHLAPVRILVLLYAKSIIVLSPVHKNALLNMPLNRLVRNRIEKKIIVIPNGIDEVFFENNTCEDLKSNGHKFSILFVGRLDTNKCVIELINAFNLIVEDRHPSNDCTLTIIGDGPLANAILKGISGNNNVNFIGYIQNKKKLAKYMMDASVLVVPSRYESFGQVYIEALTQQTKVIFRAGQGIDGFFSNAPMIKEIKGVEPATLAREIIDLEAAVTTRSDWMSLKLEEKFSWDKIIYRLRKEYYKCIL